MMVWLNGEWKKEGEAAVAANDGAFLRGEGVFETMLALRGRPIRLERHWERLQVGCQRFGLECPEVEEARQICAELLGRNGFLESSEERLRVRVTRSPHSILYTVSRPPEVSSSLRMVTSPYRRNERSALSGLKAISYGENALALAAGRELGADEVLYLNTKEEWCEGGWSNVFAVEEGRLVTPLLESGCLPGVTREWVMELAGGAGLEVKEEVRLASDFSRFEEMFVTSSLLGIGSVAQLDELVFRLGPVTELLSRALAAAELEQSRL